MGETIVEEVTPGRIATLTSFIYDYFATMENVHVMALFLTIICGGIVGGYVAYQYSDSYATRKILRDTLEGPLELNNLITDETWRGSHKFIESLYQETDYLDKFFVYHNYLE